MAAERAYLDYNASAPLTQSARAAAVAALGVTANPSSVHSEGRQARRIVEEARASVAALVNARPEHVVFTSGATEAATCLLTPEWQLGRSPLKMGRLYVSAADHPCVLSGGRFAPDQVTRIGVARDGILDLEALSGALGGHDRGAGLPLVALHAANNETGVIQPFAEIAAMVKAAGGVLVLDAVQAAGRISLDISAGCGDFLILSSHKIGGPKGAGAIVGVSDLMMPKPLVVGGGQEKGFRAGTENLPAIAGFGAAARDARAGLSDVTEVASRRDAIEAIVREMAAGAEFYGAEAERLPNTSFFSIPDMKAETAQIAFDLAGVALSAGSACSSGRVGPSHVLKAMGFGEAAGALRVSIGRTTTDADVEWFRAALATIVARRSEKAA
jgi:cysteine desulfurase